MTVLAQVKHEIERERMADSTSERRAAGKNFGGRPRTVMVSRIACALRLIEAGELAAQVGGTWASRG
ncbi:hypothetical protein GSU68_19510 (plasmid) [Rathayibacter sp. VKM Ac-2759]|uniref:hypothetical protein n=1 Tax=Rathayibacter sp. VKM Ac-2759 TaxID=2609252 RepID=UPI0013184CD9|nr:hypothetical protein [Rathayibacter sp. VKM Ac-2759]QHC68908.1 hypothetical protein GSU68_19510 [Rathayibacter sp. VKM Ac-2759]